MESLFSGHHHEQGFGNEQSTLISVCSWCDTLRCRRDIVLGVGAAPVRAPPSLPRVPRCSGIFWQRRAGLCLFPEPGMIGLSVPQALIDILCLDALAVGTLCSWYRINRVAALLLLPYLGWLAMATCLTIRIWKDNSEHKSD